MERPKSIEYWSPNYTPKDPGRAISCVIIHATAGSKESSLEWLCSPESQVSAHYLIDEFGAIYHLVHEQNISWHAGVSELNGISGVNNFSVGIELVNPNDGKTEYPKPQLDSCCDLVYSICQDYKIAYDSVVGHCDIAPGRKTDPAGFKWQEFRDMLKSKEVK